MLYILTGNIETGKTRWLEDFYVLAAKQNINVAGVIAPAIWEKSEKTATPYSSTTRTFSSMPDSSSSNNSKVCLKKIAITNVLLPQKELLTVATRKDSTQQETDQNPGKNPSQKITSSAKSKYKSIRWDFNEEAFCKVNDHFSKLANANTPALLVIDELGPKELEFNEGVTNAVALLRTGPTSIYQDAIIVVRTHLLPLAKKEFSNWGAPTILNVGTPPEQILSSLHLFAENHPS